MAQVNARNLEIVLSVADMAPKELKVLGEQIDRLEGINRPDGEPSQYGSGGKDEEKELRQAIISAVMGGITGFVAAGPLGVVGGIIGGFLLEQLLDERDAFTDAQAEAAPLGINPKEFAYLSLLPGTTNEDIYRLIEQSADYGVVSNPQDTAALLASLGIAASQDNDDPLGFGSNVLDFLTGKEIDELGRDVPDFHIPDNFETMSSIESVEEFVSQFWDDYLRAVGPGGEFAEVMRGTSGAWWANEGILPSTRLEKPDILEQLVLDHYEELFASLANQDEKLFDVARSQHFENIASQPSMEAWGERYQIQADSIQDQRSLNAWGERYQAMADAYAVDDLASSAEDFLGISTYVSDEWADIKAGIIGANDEGLAPLTESAKKLQDTMRSYAADDAVGLVVKGIIPAATESAPPRPTRRKPGQSKDERLEELLFSDDPPIPAYEPRLLTRQQEESMFAFKGLDTFASGGPLADLALVGEAGPELIINGVVIPAQESRKLMALGLLPGRRFAFGGPLDASYTPIPADFDPLNAGQRQAILYGGAGVSAARRASSGRSEPAPASQNSATRDLGPSTAPAASMQQLVMQSVSESTSMLVDSVSGLAGFSQADLTLDMLQANMRSMRELQHSIQQGNDRLAGKIDQLSTFMERQILETKRMKIYFRDAVRFISD